MPANRLSLLVATLTSTIAIAGCGAGVGVDAPPTAPSSGTLAQVRSVITGFARAMARGNGPSACALMDVQAQTQIAQEATNGLIDGSLPAAQLCQQAIAAFAARLDGAERAVLDSVRVGHVTVEQDTATVDPSQITSPAGGAPLSETGAESGSPMTLALQNGQWLIDSFD